MRSVIVGVTVILALTAIVSFFADSTAALQPAAYSTYIVAPGDTLWGIAAQLAPPNLDRRAYVYRLRQLNGLLDSPVIHPGQTLRLPIGR